MESYYTRQLHTESGTDKEKWQALLFQNGLYPEQSADIVYGVFADDLLIATGARFRNILKMIAVDPLFRGGAAFNAVMEALLTDAFLAGFNTLFLYAKPESVRAFQVLGFRTVVAYRDQITFMERGQPGIEAYLTLLASKKVPSQNAGAVVMHANPFTNGHLFLIEHALTVCDTVYVFVLSEDRAVFAPDVRLRLVNEGVRHLNSDNLRVVTLPTADYLVSSATFPSYFAADSDEVTRLQAGVDAALFKARIAPVLDIRYRFVGEEPNSAATALYNRSLADALLSDPQLVIIPRLEKDGQVISASRVRSLWRDGHLELLRPLVPASTWHYLSKTPAPVQ